MGNKVHVAASDRLSLTNIHPDQAYDLGPRLRAIDKFEMINIHGNPHALAEHILHESICISDEAYGIVGEGDHLHGAWGHGFFQGPGVITGQGYVWLLSDDILFDKYAIEMTRKARENIFPHLDSVYTSYGNNVMTQNLVHTRWLLRAGFQSKGHLTVNDIQYTSMIRTPNV